MTVLSVVRRFFHRNRVQFVPSLSPMALIRSPRATWAELLPKGKDTLLTYSGSAALYQAAKVLGLSAGDTVLVPDYNCGHEFEPMLRLGARVKSYPVDDQLRPDTAGLRTCIEPSVKAVLVIHYFGILQDLTEMRKICDESGIRLIEDCAHLLGTGGQVGVTGDLAIFSFRKSLPIPNGGALVMNDDRLHRPNPLASPPWPNTLNKGLLLLSKFFQRPSGFLAMLWSRCFLLALLPLLVIGRVCERLGLYGEAVWFDPDDEDFDYPGEVLCWGMAPVSRRLLLRQDISNSVTRRRQNYQYLGERLAGTSGLEVLIQALPAHSCPLVFPVRVAAPEALFETLADQQIYTGVWWEGYHPGLAWPDSPGSRLKARVLALPVHQDLGRAQLDRLVDGIKAAL